MDFGILTKFEVRRGGDQAAAFREGFDIVDAAAGWGLDRVWLGRDASRTSRCWPSASRSAAPGA